MSERLHILIVDDDPQFCRILRARSFAVTLVADPHHVVSNSRFVAAISKSRTAMSWTRSE